MQKDSSKDYKILEQIDSIMFDLYKSKDVDQDILKVGKLMKKINLVDDPTNIDEVKDKYLKNLSARIKKIVNKPEA